MDPNALEFRNFEPSDRAAAINLLSRDRPSRYRAIKEAIFDWQFHANPHDDGSNPFLVGTLGDEVVALSGFMPVNIRHQGRTLKAIWSCDTYVAPEFRGHGFGKQLISRASTRAPLMLVFGISDMSDPIFEKSGWILNPDNRMLFLHLNEPGPKGAIKNLRTRFARFPHGDRGNPCLQTSRHDEDFGDDVDDLWQRSAAGYSSIVERDAAFLNWKYRRHPLNRYIWHAVRTHGELRGLVVTRHGHITSSLVDYCGPADDSELMHALVNAATADLAARGTVRVQCETTHPALLRVLGQCGFVGSRYRSRFRVRSNLPHDAHAHAQQEWFLMAGDSDGDMLGNTPLAAD